MKNDTSLPATLHRRTATFDPPPTNSDLLPNPKQQNPNPNQQKARFTPQQEANALPERISIQKTAASVRKALSSTDSENQVLPRRVEKWLSRIPRSIYRLPVSCSALADPLPNPKQEKARFTPQQEANTFPTQSATRIDRQLVTTGPSRTIAELPNPISFLQPPPPDRHSPNQSELPGTGTHRRTFRLRASTFLFVPLLLAGCSKKESTEPTAVPVQAATAHIQSITEHTVADAVLAPIAQAAISPKIIAPVKKFYVQRGSHVSAGQLLATLENADLAAAVTDNQGAFDAADATYQTAVKAQVPEDYQNAQLAVAQAKANLELNQHIVDSRKQLFAQGAIAGRDLDTAEAALVQARAAYDTAAKHLAGMNEVSHAAAIKAAKGTFESAEGKYKGAEAQFGYSEIRSPIKGVVTDRPLYAGETPAPGGAFITVMDTSALLAKIHLSQSQAQLLKTGDPAEVSVPGLDDPVPGKITLVSPALDPGSTTVEIWVRLENPKGIFRPGTAVHVSIAGRSAPKAVVVPSESIIVPASGKTSVMVIGSDGVAHLTPVNTGIADDGMTQIVSGLQAGQQIVTVGAASLDDGTKVEIKAAGDDSEKSDDAKPAAGKEADDK